MKIISLPLLAIVALAVNAGADEPKAAAPQAVRNILERHDQSGVQNKEIVIGTATLPPGSAIGFHTHPGDESGYVLKGPLVWKVQGQPDRVLKTGESFFNPRGSVHSVAPGPGSDGAMAVSSWIVDKGVPMATPVPSAN
jgi:quercetin dioxygenase-like cupin family protein